MEESKDGALTRRSLVKGAAWAVPVVAVAAAAPAAAVTIVKDPGINGWVTTNTEGGWFNNCRKTVTVNSQSSGTGPDGAPFGLYIYDVNVSPNPDVITNAEMIYWIPSNLTGTPSWSTLSGHSNCWSGPTDLGNHVKPDGITYRGYKWTYTCSIDPNDAVEGSDGESRLFLGNFHVQGSYRLSGNCWTYNYWAERRVTINGDVNCFQRRAGSSASIGTTPCDLSTVATNSITKQESLTPEKSIEGVPAEESGEEQWELEHEGVL